MDYTAASIIVFCLLVAGNMLWLAREITTIKKMLRSIIEGGGFTMPKIPIINNGMHMLELAVAAGGRIAKRAVEKRRAKRIRNLDTGENLTTVDDAKLRKLAAVIVREAERSNIPVKLTEATWIGRGKFAREVGGSADEWRACMDRFEKAGIITRMGKKNVRIWREPYGVAVFKLKQMVKHG